MPNTLLGDAADDNQGVTLGASLVHQDLGKPAWSLYYPSEAEELPLAGTAKQEGHDQIPRKLILPPPLQKMAVPPTRAARPTPHNPGAPRAGAPFSCLCKACLKLSKRRRKI